MTAGRPRQSGLSLFIMWMAAAFVPERGKGSHGTLYYGEKLPIVRNLVLIGIKLEN